MKTRAVGYTLMLLCGAAGSILVGYLVPAKSTILLVFALSGATCFVAMGFLMGYFWHTDGTNGERE